MLYYSAQTGGFYDDEIHRSIPADAVNITQDQHTALLTGEAAGQIIFAGEKGFPVLVDPEPLSDEALIAQARQWRDSEIDSLKWLRERHRDEVDAGRATTLTVAQFGELIDYVQQLRDWPSVEGFPASKTKPLRPNWIDQQTQ